MVKLLQVTSFDTVVVLSINLKVSIVYYPSHQQYDVVKNPMSESRVVMSTESGRFAKEMAKEIDQFFQSTLDEFLDLTGWYNIAEPLL